ncbi:MAG: sulfurtransferase, partial [Oxalobacteraceae bacterium]|nr:sulfurtransferase [Oxalobacteraceae bacterium]
MQSSQATVNISAYKFVTLDDTTDLRPRFLQRCQ